MRIISFLISVFITTTSFASTPIKISLDWLLTPHHAPLVIGIEKGFFREQGLDVTLIGSMGSLEGCKQAAAGNVDFALALEPQWIIQTANGLNLKGVCTLIPTPLEVFVSRIPLSELKGKRIGHCSSGVGFSAAVLREILTQQKISMDEVELIYTRSSLASCLMSGQVDAVTNIYRTYGLVDIQKYRQDFYVYPLENLGIPPFAALIVVAGPGVSSEIQAKLVAALKKSCDYVQKNLEEGWAVFKGHGLELDTPTNKDVWGVIVPLFDINPLDTASPHHQKLAEFLKKHALLG